MAPNEKVVLIVEDDPDIRSLAQQDFSAAGLVALGVAGVRKATFKLKNQNC